MCNCMPYGTLHGNRTWNSNRKSCLTLHVFLPIIDSQMCAVGLWPAYSCGGDTCPILRRKINVLWSSGLFVMNSNGKSHYLSIYFQSVWFPAVHHLSTRCTTRPNFSPYPEIASFMVGQRLLHEDAGGRWASIAARLGGAFCSYKSTNSMMKNR